MPIFLFIVLGTEKVVNKRKREINERVMVEITDTGISADDR